MILFLENLSMKYRREPAATVFAMFSNVACTRGTPQDLATAYGALSDYYEARGQLERAIEYALLTQSQIEQFSLPLAAIMSRLGPLGTFVKAGQTERAYETLEAVRAELTPPWDAFLPMGELNIYRELEEPDSAERTLEG